MLVDSVICGSFVGDLESMSVATCAIVYDSDAEFGHLNVIPLTWSAYRVPEKLQAEVDRQLYRNSRRLLSIVLDATMQPPIVSRV